MAIERFEGEHAFLSNFWPSRVKLDGMLYYPTVEHAYQAAKTENAAERRDVRMAFTPAQAKKLGQRVTLREHWNDGLKLEIMLDLLRQKFSFGSDLAGKLLNTGDEELIEGNTWRDTYWGVCQGVGENHLGKLLMKVRQELHDA